MVSHNESNISQSMTIMKHKLVFLGDQSVGKTSIINRYIYDMFDEKDHVYFFKKKILIKFFKIFYKSQL